MREKDEYGEFITATIQAKKCDILVDVPYALQQVKTTRPYFISSYVFVYKKARAYDVTSLEQVVSNSIAARRLGLWLLAVFALGALTLAAIGIYGVVSYSVSQRTSEFGIRMALGARPADILRRAIGDSLPMIVAGLAAGVAGSLAISKVLAGFLYGVRATDASTFASRNVCASATAATNVISGARWGGSCGRSKTRKR